MIKAINLTKKFKDFTAVDSINLLIKPGEIYGFLGPNGAGKTTTIRMLTGTLKPTSGEVLIIEKSYKDYELEIKRNIGVVPDEPKMYENLKGSEFIEFIISVYKLDPKEAYNRFEEICEAFNIDYINNFIGDYSHGMKQKLMVASVLMRKPKVIFLDEPTVGLDAKATKILKEILHKYKEDGCCIFLTTHILEIAEKMCDRIGIIDHGRIIAEGTLEELRTLSKTGSTSLEDIFLELTGGEEIMDIIKDL